MARFDSIKQTIDSNIKSNGNQEITGQKLNAVLNGMMSSIDEALTEVENAIPEEIVPPVGGEKELMQVYLRDTLTTEQKAANVEVFNALAEGKGIIPYALYSSNIPMPFTNMIKWTVSGVADHFTLKSYNLDTLAEGKCSVVAVVINSDGTTSSSQSDINLPTGEGAGNSVEAAILEFNSSGLALSAEQKAHNAEIYQKIFNNETVQVYLNIGALVPLQYSSISGTEIILYASAIITAEPSSLRYQSLKLSSDGDLQFLEQKEYPLGGSSEGGVAELMVSTTYADLVALRDAGNLVPGMKYRITDYETITTKEGSQSAGHPFDIIVTALDNKTISENASAIQSARDTDGYFAQANLKAWQLKYALDNTDGRFDFVPRDIPAYMNVSITVGEETATAFLLAIGSKDVINEKECYIFINIESGLPFASESEDLQAGGSILVFDDGSFVTGTINSVENIPPVYNGKGVIYRMIDAQGNSCPYDFKNIKFLRTDTEGAETYEYTFSYHSANGQKDYSEYVNCYDNFMADGCWDNVFVHILQTRISGNKFGDGCTGNTLGEENYDVIFGAGCENNTLAGYNNGCVFGNKCSDNYLDTTSANCIFGPICTDNKLGKGCRGNRFGNYFQSNILGDNCIYNSFGERCSNNALGDECRDNHFGNNCKMIKMGSYSLANTFGNECEAILFVISSSNTQTRDYNRYNVVENGCKTVVIYALETPSADSQIQKVHIYPGIPGTTQSPVYVEIPATGNAYSYSVAKNSAGELKVYVEADLVQ